MRQFASRYAAYPALIRSNVQKSLVICTHDIPTLFNIGGTHLYAFMGHVDGHFMVFLCRNSYIPRTNRKFSYFFSFFFYFLIFVEAETL